MKNEKLITFYNVRAHAIAGQIYTKSLECVQLKANICLRGHIFHVFKCKKDNQSQPQSSFAILSVSFLAALHLG